ncbi:MAG TPA: hypothetical protein VJN64_02615 [Terriglobales bacterium]|nr:hypothetical protein [Terriglobales bacterium]
MSTSQVLDRTFSLYRNNFVVFAGIAVLPPAVLLVLQMLLLLAKSGPAKHTAASAGTPAVAGALVGGALFGGVYLLGYALALGASIFAVSRLHLGKPTSISHSYGEIKPFVWKILGVVVLGFVIVGALMAAGILAVALPVASVVTLGVAAKIVATLVGVVVLVVCFIYAVRLSLSFALATPACMLEKLGVIDSLKRSRVLAKGSIGRIFLVSLLAGVIGGALSVALNIPTFVAAAEAGAKHQAVSLTMQIWQLAGSFLASTLAGPIATIAIALIYYDERVRKEAFDLQLMMEAIGIPKPAPQAQTQAAGGTFPTAG